MSEVQARECMHLKYSERAGGIVFMITVQQLISHSSPCRCLANTLWDLDRADLVDLLVHLLTDLLQAPSPDPKPSPPSPDPKPFSSTVIHYHSQEVVPIKDACLYGPVPSPLPQTNVQTSVLLRVRDGCREDQYLENE